MTCKPSGPIGWMLNGPAGTRRMENRTSGDFYDELQASSDTQAVGSHRSDGDGPLGPTGLIEMENDPTGTRDT